MSNIVLKRSDGGVLMPSVTWRSAVRKENGVTAIATLTGKATGFTLVAELQKLRGVVTNWGVYKDHTLTMGAPNIYDEIEIEFQSLLNPPVYLYDMKGATASAPLQDHPSYKTFWDHYLVGKGQQRIAADTLNGWQGLTVADSYTSNKTYEWRRAGSVLGDNNFVVKTTAATASLVTSGHANGEPYKNGTTSYKVESPTVRETVYFTEKPDYTFSFLGQTFTVPALNTKSINNMLGKAGWPMRTTFGWPMDTYSMLNNTTITVGGVSYAVDNTFFRYLGVTPTGSQVSITEAFYKSKGIPTTAYINSTNYPAMLQGFYKGSSFGHPLWLCTSVDIKKIGYWYEATLMWQFAQRGIDADLYGLAIPRVLGLA